MGPTSYSRADLYGKVIAVSAPPYYGISMDNDAVLFLFKLLHGQ